MSQPLKMEDAMRRCDVRLSRLDSVEQVDARPGMEIVDRRDVVVCCIGTDVPGAAWLQVLNEDAEELCTEIERAGACDCEGSVPPVLTCMSRVPAAGMLNRIFWLGYEFGRAER